MADSYTGWTGWTGSPGKDGLDASVIVDTTLEDDGYYKVNFRALRGGEPVPGGNSIKFTPPTGPTGFTGYTGWTGWTGLPGADGTGDTGWTGWTGLPGADGTGYTGWTGWTGRSYTGWTGWTGKGYTGWTGWTGLPAGFGEPTAMAKELEAGSPPTASVEASGPDTAKIFSFSFGIPKGAGVNVSVDECSIDKNGGDDDESKFQIAHFNDGKKNSGKGIATRLKADTKTGEITAQDSEGLMLVARKDGQVIYIPLSGDGKDPEPPEPDPGRGCDDHPGGGDAVGPDDDDDNHGGGYAGGGGVPAESGESVPGGGAASCCY